LEAELKSLDAARDHAQRAEQTAADALTALPDGAILAAELARARALAAEARTAASEARAALETGRREALARSQRLAGLGEDVTRWASRRDAAVRQMEALSERIADMNRDLSLLEAAPEEIAARRSRLLDAIGRAEETRREAADARAQ